MTSMSIKLVVFDMDGTVVDSMPSLTDLAVEVLQSALGLSYGAALGEYQRTVGHPFIVQLGFMGVPPQYAAVIADVYSRRHRGMAPKFPLGADVQTLMKWLHRRGIETALVSSTERSIIDSMHRISWHHFHCIGGYTASSAGSSTSWEKRKQEQIGDMLDWFRVLKHEVLYVGDSTSDADVAKDVGVAFLQTNVKTLWPDTLAWLEDRWKAERAL